MDNELFELMTKIYGEMQEGFKRLDGEIAEVKKMSKKLKDG